MAISAVDASTSLNNVGPSSIKSSASNKATESQKDLFALIGPSVPPLVAHFAKPRFKQKQDLPNNNKVKWERRAFTPEARKDSLKLEHWTKAPNDPNSQNPFSKYNIQTTQYTYSAEEYTRLLEDPDWTKEETDYLFQVTSDYDGRWYVIHDRYDYPGGAPRSIEDLKDRYFSVCRKLVRDRPWAGDEAGRTQLLNALSFDKDREVTRKRYLASLEDRTQEQKDEEEALYIELKRMEQRERHFRRGRDELLRTIAGINSGLPDVLTEDSPFTGAMELKRKKKGGSYIDYVDSPSTPSVNTIALPPPAPAPSARRSQAVTSQDIENCVIRVEPPPNNKSGHHAAAPRTSKIPYVRGPLAEKVAQAMAELNVTYNRLMMPTRENIALLESLQNAIVALLEQKKLVDKIDQEIQQAKERLGHRTSEAPSGDAMEAEEAVDDEGRAQSVMSARGRGRKERRSVSVSSVDTVSTTRAGTKRQKRG